MVFSYDYSVLNSLVLKSTAKESSKCILFLDKPKPHNILPNSLSISYTATSTKTTKLVILLNIYNNSEILILAQNRHLKA